MRQRRIALLMGSLLLFNSSQAFSADLRPALLILNDAVDINGAAQGLETAGARVRSRVPPSILTVDLPAGFSTKNIAGVRTIYQTAVPLSALQPMGSLAVAAGMRWNRSLLATSKASGGSSFGAMRSLVAQKSLNAPTGVIASQQASMIVVSWSAVPSALFYEVEAALDRSFSNRVFGSKTSSLSINMPAPPGDGTTLLYYRVRAIDHGDDEHRRVNNIYGAWSYDASINAIRTPATETRPAPTLSAPLNGYKSEGFTIILEWLENGAGRSRVQVSDDKDFRNTLFDTVVIGREFVCPSPAMELDQTLYWRVQSWDDEKSPWSEIRRFKIGMPHTGQSDVFINPEAPR